MLGGGEADLHALLEATRLVAASAGRDLDAVLDALVEQTRRLLDGPGVTIHLAEAGSNLLRRRRANPLARPGTPQAEAGSTFMSDAFLAEAIATRRPIFTPDLHGEPRIHDEVKAAFPTVVCAMAVPLFADDHFVGALFAHFTEPRQVSEGELRLVEALGQHAAIAIQSARLLDEARRVHTELEAVFEAAGDGIIVIDQEGNYLRMNDVARTWLASRMGHVPTTVAAFRELAHANVEGGGPGALLAGERALRGEYDTEELVVRGVDGSVRYLHSSAAPIRDAGGNVVAAVIIAREITALRHSIAEHARLDGAVKTARRVTHELNNQLSLVAGYGELLTGMTSGPAGELASRLHRGAMNAAETLQLLQRIIRFEESEFGGQVMLDLEQSTRPPA